MEKIFQTWKAQTFVSCWFNHWLLVIFSIFCQLSDCGGKHEEEGQELRFATRIVGGRKTREFKMCIPMRNNLNSGINCCAVLINDQFILTAAHCLNQFE